MLVEMGVFSEQRSREEHLKICEELHEILAKNNSASGGENDDESDGDAVAARTAGPAHGAAATTTGRCY